MYYRKMAGAHVYLSPICQTDVDSYLRWMNEDRELAENFGQYPQMVASSEDLKWLFEPPKNMHRFAIVRCEDDTLIGSISLHNIDHLNRNAYIGIFIGGAEHRGKGFGTEAIRLILAYGFRTMNLHSINLTVHADNLAGITCYRKVGFTEVGRLPEVLFVNGKYVDKVYMSILEQDFSGLSDREQA